MQVADQAHGVSRDVHFWDKHQHLARAYAHERAVSRHQRDCAAQRRAGRR
jgi:hypothetical protein